MAELANKQASRKISIYRSKTGKLENIMSDAAFYGELKNQAGIDPSKESVMIKETKVSLIDDQAQLPEGEFLIFVSAKKVKSGSDKDVSKMSFNELRAYAKTILPKVPVKKDEILKALSDFKKESSKAENKKKAASSKSEKATEAVNNQEIIFGKKEHDMLMSLSSIASVILKNVNQLLVESGHNPIPTENTDPIASQDPKDKPYSEFSPEELKKKEEAEEEARLKKQLDDLKKESEGLTME